VKPLIAVVDYEMGNLHSVAKALECAGARVQVTSSPRAMRKADGIVLPGVGAFGEAVKRLRAQKLVAPILEALGKGTPFLGICLGLQLLFERSEESAGVRGLGVFAGDVERFPRGALKVPHMGWNIIERGPAGRTEILKGVSANSYFYFVHSYYPAPEDRGIIATRTDYGRAFCSSIAQGRVYASQFHPEKSGAAGQRLLRNFVQEVSAC